jgi:hypothetical protein
MNLPEELVTKILLQLSTGTLVNISEVCKNLHTTVNSFEFQSKRFTTTIPLHMICSQYVKNKFLYLLVIKIQL